MFLLGDEFSLEEKRRNFDFYDPLTTGDSSLSACVQGILAFELGYTEKASEYARHAALVDLADAQGNAADGCHIASMGGTWMLMVYGIAGFRDHGGCFSFHPSAMARDVRVRFPLRIRGSTLEVDFTSESVTYTLREGDELVFCHHDAEIRLSKQEPVAVRKRSRG
jgi:alpha,alpha-trehalose phosphorylase